MTIRWKSYVRSGPPADRALIPPTREPVNNDEATAWAVFLGANTVKRLAAERRWPHHRASMAITRARQRGAIYAKERPHYLEEIRYAVTPGFLPVEHQD